MPVRVGALSRDFSDADLIENEAQQLQLCARNADDQPPGLVRVKASQGDGAFPVDESGYIRGAFG